MQILNRFIVKHIWRNGRQIKKATPPEPTLCTEKGFSLIEALIATAIIGIGFVGVYSMVSLSEQFTKWAIARQKLQLYASQMLEVIEGDIAVNGATANYMNNYNLSLTSCVNPGSSEETYKIRAYEWCTGMNLNIAPATASDIRTITATNNSGNKWSIVIRLEAYGTKAQVIMEKIYVAS
jgi:hypothetical protein